MKRVNNKGFGKLEFITMFGVIAILLAIGANLALNTGGNNYNGFKTIANSFAKNAAMYKDHYTKKTSIYYLYEVIDKGYIEELSNPMDTKEKCDKYNSYIDMENPSRKRVILVCGNYLVDGVQSVSYKIYELSEWHEVKESTDNDSAVAYNYKKDGKVMLDEYLTERDFIAKYFEMNKVMLNSANDLNSNEEVELIYKPFYRTKTFVKELK